MTNSWSPNRLLISNADVQEMVGFILLSLLALFYFVLFVVGWLVDRPGLCSPEKPLSLVVTDVSKTCVEAIFRNKSTLKMTSPQVVVTSVATNNSPYL